jgi:glc operon protein GlcG
MAIPEDYDISMGVVSVCIIDEKGQIYGKMFGNDKVRCRDSFKIAWTKASQVWITGYKTHEYEKLVFADKIDHHQFGINMPDMIGWEGGQPVTLQDGTKLSIGFSGFRGTTDLEIVLKAIEKADIALK